MTNQDIELIGELYDTCKKTLVGYKSSSTRKETIPPDFTITELMRWMSKQENYAKIMRDWQRSRFSLEYKPKMTFKAIFDGKYVFSNMELSVYHKVQAAYDRIQNPL